MAETKRNDGEILFDGYSNMRTFFSDQSKGSDILNVHFDVFEHSDIEEQESDKGKVIAHEVQMETPNKIIKPPTGYSEYMDKLGTVTDSTPTELLMADLQSSCFPSVMGYIPPNTVDADRFEKVRKQQIYSEELSQQIEDKHTKLKKDKEDDKHESVLENERVETTIRNLHLNTKDHGHGRHCYSPDFPLSDFPTPVSKDPRN